MPAVLERDDVIEYSTNDSHTHIDPDAKARRERLGLTLKPGETDEIAAPGTRHACAICNPAGDLPAIVRPNNGTYDHSLAAKKQDKMDVLEAEVAELRQLLLERNAEKAAAKSTKGA